MAPLSQGSLTLALGYIRTPAHAGLMRKAPSPHLWLALGYIRTPAHAGFVRRWGNVKRAGLRLVPGHTPAPGESGFIAIVGASLSDRSGRDSVRPIVWEEGVMPLEARLI